MIQPNPNSKSKSIEAIADEPKLIQLDHNFKKIP